MMMPIFTKLLAISIVAESVLEFSNNKTTLLNEGIFLLFKMFMSLFVNEKNATSLPEIIKENKNKTKTVSSKIVVAVCEMLKKQTDITFKTDK
jgi:hypothetical protein